MILNVPYIFLLSVINIFEKAITYDKYGEREEFSSSNIHIGRLQYIVGVHMPKCLNINRQTYLHGILWCYVIPWPVYIDWELQTWWQLQSLVMDKYMEQLPKHMFHLFCLVIYLYN